MPFMKKVNGKSVRDYQAELAWEKRTTGKGRQNDRSERNQARASVEKDLGHKLPTSQHVDHKQALSKGGSNAKSNLKVTSASQNTSFARNSKGGMLSEMSKRERKGKK